VSQLLASSEKLTINVLVRYLTPPFGTYAALSAQLSGSLRHTHSRLAEFAEEIAFLGGEETEKLLLEREYASMIKHENRVLTRRWWFHICEEGVIKWLWGSYGVSAFCTLDELTFQTLSSARHLCYSRLLPYPRS